jgi:hypothetical protein
MNTPASLNATQTRSETMNAKELADSKLERAFCAAHCSCNIKEERRILELIRARES